MAQPPLARLTALDASFLHQEGPSSHMHVGALCRFEGPPPPFDELLDTLRMRLHLVPRYRQRLQLPPAHALPPAAPPPPPPAAPPRRHRPATVGRRFDVRPRVPRPPDGAAAAG